MLNTRGVSSFNDLNRNNTSILVRQPCIFFTDPPYLASQVLPAGSGNGLCKSILHASGCAECGAVQAARVVARGLARPLDLAEVTLSASSPAVPN